MRSLVTDPSEISPGLYHRFLRHAQVDGLLADHLVRGEPYLALNAVVLDPGEHATLRHLTTVFSSVFHRAGRVLARNVAAVQDVGFPWVAAELVAAEAPRVPVIGRFDYVRDVSGRWWLLEFNADTPSGVREAIIVDDLVRRFLPKAGELPRPTSALARAMIDCFVEAVRDLPGEPVLGIVTDAGELEDLAQMAFTGQLLTEPLRAGGVSIVLGDVDNLRMTRRGLALGDRVVGALYRYVPFELMLGSSAFAAIYDAVASGQTRLLNGLYGLLLQHKGLIAWIWEHRDDPLFSPEERAAIRSHLPPTWPIDRAPEASGTGPVAVKQVFGREGEEVYFSDDLTAEQWSELRQQRTYVVQRRIAVDEFDAVVQTSEGPIARRGHATVGGFAVAGKWAGYYTRFGSKIITANAKWLATLVDRQAVSNGANARKSRE